MYLLILLLLITSLTRFKVINGLEEHLPVASCLRELPLDRLLYIKREFNEENWGRDEYEEEEKEEDKTNNDCPKAQPLIMKRRNEATIFRDRGGTGSGGIILTSPHHYPATGWQKSPSPPHKSNKKSKIVSKVFQGTITALSFLAFGGYLLCIIIRAFRQKLANVNVTINGTFMIGRRKRDLNIQAMPLSATKSSWPESPWEIMFEVLLSISQGYATYYESPMDQDYEFY